MKLNRNFLVVPVLLGMAFSLVNCKNKPKKEETVVLKEMTQATITKSDFGMTSDSIAVEKYSLVNANGMEVNIITYGGIITSLKVPSQDSIFKDVVLGHDIIKSESVEQDKKFIDHLTHLVVHGILHLLGYDHVDDKDALQMEAFEVKILNQLAIASPY